MRHTTGTGDMGDVGDVGDIGDMGDMGDVGGAGDGLRDPGRLEDAGTADPAAPIDGGCDGRCRSCPVCALLAQLPTVSGFPGRVASSVNRPEVTGHLLAAAGELAAAMSVALGAYAEQAYATTGPGTHPPDEGSTGLHHDDTAFQRITVE